MVPNVQFGPPVKRQPGEGGAKCCLSGRGPRAPGGAGGGKAQLPEHPSCASRTDLLLRPSRHQSWLPASSVRAKAPPSHPAQPQTCPSSPPALIHHLPPGRPPPRPTHTGSPACTIETSTPQRRAQTPTTVAHPLLRTDTTTRGGPHTLRRTPAPQTSSKTPTPTSTFPAKLCSFAIN